MIGDKKILICEFAVNAIERFDFFSQSCGADYDAAFYQTCVESVHWLPKFRRDEVRYVDNVVVSCVSCSFKFFLEPFW